jgi:hypothetical protein
MVSKEPEALDANGILANIEVQALDDVSLSHAGKLDIDHFFGAPFDHAGKSGMIKEHRKCKICA